MSGSMDNINELVGAIESQGFDYVFAILEQKDDKKTTQKIKIYTNYGENALDKLLKVLKEYKKTQPKNSNDKR